MLHPSACRSTHTGYQLGAITADVVKGQRRLAVSGTTGIAVGQWVRLWARSPLGTRRRRSVLEPAEHARAAAAARAARTGRGAAPRTGSRRLQAGAGGFLPLSPAMEEAWRQAQVRQHLLPTDGGVQIGWLRFARRAAPS